MKLRTQVRLRSSQKCQGAPRRAKGNPKGAQGRPRGSQRLPKSDQKGIQNGTQDGSRFPSRARDPYFHKKVIWSMPVQSKSLRKKPVLAMEREARFLSLETFERVGQHVPKQSRTAYSCAWPTYLRIYLSIYLSIYLAP